MNTFHVPSRPARAWRAAAVAGLLVLAAQANAESKTTLPSSPIFHACAGALAHGSTSIVSNNGRQKWTIQLNGGRCSIDFRMEGKPQFNDDFTDLVSLAPGGWLRLDVTDDGDRHHLEIEPGRNGLERTWKVNGRVQPYDATAREWFAAFLIELDRRTAVGVDQRLPHLLRKGGASAVLAETGEMPSDYARSVYYSKLAAAARLSSADVVRVLDQAASLETSDYYAAELLKSLGARAAGEAGVRAATFRLIQTMSSDYYQAESVRYAVGSGRIGATEVDLLIDMVPRIKSDYYKTDVLKQILTGGSLDAAQRRRLAGLARDIHEDSYACEFVKSLAASGDLGPGGARALVDAAATIESDYYLSEATSAIIAHTTLSEADLLAIVKAAAATPSEYYRAEMLRKVLAHRATTDAVRRAALDATGGMSSYYRGEVERATGRR
jgi:hypothetical protein